MDSKKVKQHKILNTMLYIHITIVFIICILLLMNMIVFKDSQRRLTFNEEKFVGLTLAECEDKLGGAIIDYGSMACFDGGSEWKIELGSLFCYKEYQLIVYFDENGFVKGARTENTLDLIL